MNEVEKAYLAGLVDGEGYIGVTRATRGDREYYYLKLQIQLTNEKIIRYVAQITEGKVTGPYNYGGQGVLSLVLFGKKAVLVLAQIAPYLVGKCVQAELAGMFPLGDKVGGRMSAESKRTQEKIYYEIRGMNNKG